MLISSAALEKLFPEPFCFYVTLWVKIKFWSRQAEIFKFLKGVNSRVNKIKWTMNKQKSGILTSAAKSFNIEATEKVMKFHSSFAGYTPTPLRNLTSLAEHLGVAAFYAKDESYRFGLNAFKVLGGSYAMGRYIAERLDLDMTDLTFDKITSAEVQKKLGKITFVTATDGNHGRGVAWVAARLAQKAVVYMPKGSSENRLNNIKNEGAEASITDLNYDDAVRLAESQAKKYGWVVVQDTAWEGYEDIPLWIMQGYATMAKEAYQQLLEMQCQKPTHVFLQAGVGSLAGAVQAFLANAYHEAPPKVIIVEPNAADCIFKSFEADDGKARFVGGDMETIMAGLACGEPNSIGWEILRNLSEMAISCPDWVAAHGMRVLGNPLGSDERVVSGESGALPAGCASLIMTCEALLPIRKALALDENSRILVFSTEGDTDPEKYRSIVWNGEYQSKIDKEK